ncbi:hypothetical protein LJK87_32500 [Paenibacillus sp. P25]|nr:hypothetical protein LJK87_32500 [Paenibacillus sp. P25]
MGTDTLNTFGAVALLPFSDKRLSIDVLQVFDPVLFASQLLGVVLWWTGAAAPGPLFIIINALVLLYIAAKFAFRRQAVQAVERVVRDRSGDARISLMPTFHPAGWTAVIEKSEGFRLGRVRFGRFEEELTLTRKPVHTDIEGLKRQSRAANTFYSIAERIHSEESVHDGRILLTLTDLRFRYGNYFPFRAVFELDESGRVAQERLCHKADMREPIGSRELSGTAVSAR